MRALMGSLGLMPLHEVVDFLGRRRATGTLVCERGTVRKSCHVLDGVASEASSNDPREYLGQLLINFGHITEEQLAKAFQTQQETRIRLGSVLVMVGAVKAEAVRDALALKIRETLLDAMLWDSGTFHFDEAPPPGSDDLTAHVPLADVAREAEFRSTAWQAFRSAFPTGAAALEVDEARMPRSVEPPGVNGRIVKLAREGRTIDEIALALHATDFHLYQRLYALHTQGVLRAAPVRPGSIAANGPALGPDRMLAEARRHLLEGRFAEAEECAARAVAVAPGLVTAVELAREARTALGEQLRASFLKPPRTPSLKVPPHDVPRLTLSAPERWILGRCDGSRDVAHIVQIAPLAELEVLKAMRRFVDARILEMR
ncbi:MAG TPA: DUF4388 domain-containing protein [Anaeromyxobacteraceae bacterium]|nr:DUF4388 domain-containing protein [Anaeromyxobacteraceae bacterium]